MPPIVCMVRSIWKSLLLAKLSSKYINIVRGEKREVPMRLYRISAGFIVLHSINFTEKLTPYFFFFFFSAYNRSDALESGFLFTIVFSKIKKVSDIVSSKTGENYGLSF